MIAPPLYYLTNKKVIEPDYTAPCLEKSENANLTEISLTEHIHAAMHPANQFMAYSHLVDERLSTLAKSAHQ